MNNEKYNNNDENNISDDLNDLSEDNITDFIAYYSQNPIPDNYIEQIAEMEKHSFSDPWPKKIIKLESMSQFCIIVAGVSENEVNSYMFIRDVYGEVDITNIQVAKEFRGQGLSKVLMDWLFDYCEISKKEKVSLEVRESNEVAINLYESYGFSRVNILKDYYKNPLENAIFMQKKI